PTAPATTPPGPSPTARALQGRGDTPSPGAPRCSVTPPTPELHHLPGRNCGAENRSHRGVWEARAQEWLVQHTAELTALGGAEEELAVAPWHLRTLGWNID